MKQRFLITLATGVSLSIITLYLAFRNVPFADLLAYLSIIRYIWMLPTIVLVAAAFFLRALRWQIILTSSAPVSFRMSYHPLTIGFMLNCILPGRIGEAARPLILNWKNGISFTKGIATVAAERILDAGFLILFLAVSLTNIPLKTSTNISYGEHHLNRETLQMLGTHLALVCFILIVLISFIAFDRSRNMIMKFIDRLPKKFPFVTSSSAPYESRRSISTFINRLLGHAAEGLMLFKHPLRLVACIGITLLIWLLTAFSYYTMALGCPGVDLSFLELSTMMVIICFFIALPSVPGYWGLWEAGGVFALSIFGIPSQTAAGFTLANHAVQIFPVIIMGFISSLALSVNIRRISDMLRSR